MVTVLLLTDNKKELTGLEDGLINGGDIKIVWADTFISALEAQSNEAVDLLVANENVAGIAGMDIIEKMVSVNPMINYAVVSTLSPDDFHEKSEGLGILMQLPEKPNAAKGRELMAQLNKVLSLSSIDNTAK